MTLNYITSYPSCVGQ